MEFNLPSIFPRMVARHLRKVYSLEDTWYVDGMAP